jgi:hypothetical protein
MRGVNALCFGKQNNNFGSLLNCKATTIRHFTELHLSQRVEWFMSLNAS